MENLNSNIPIDIFDVEIDGPIFEFKIKHAQLVFDALVCDVGLCLIQYFYELLVGGCGCTSKATHT